MAENTTIEHLGSGSINESSGAIHVMDVALLFSRRIRFLLAWSLGLSLALGGTSLLIRPVFTAETVIVAPDSMSPSSTSLMMGALAGSSLVSSLTKNPADLFLAILKGRTVTDEVIQRFHLDKRYGARQIEDARKDVETRAKLVADKNGLISIDYTDHDPKLAADVANAFVDALYGLQTRLASAEGKQRRTFYLEQVDDEQSALEKAEKDFVEAQKNTGIVTLSGQTESVIRSIAQLKANIASQEMALQSTLTYATEQNTDTQRLEAGLRAAREQLARLEQQQAMATPDQLRYSTGQIPEASLVYERKLREVQYHQAVLQALIKQFETAKLDEEKSAPLIQVVDRALPPTRKSGPLRSLYFIGGFILGVIVASGWILCSAFLTKLANDPVGKQKLEEIKRSLSGLRG